MQWLIAAIAMVANLTELRNTYTKAIDNSDKADLLVKLSKENKGVAIYRAYYGTGLALQAKHSWNPATKLSLANSASTELNSAVKSSSNDLEIRFLRFSVECNMPAFLNLSSHVSEDKLFILKNKNVTHAMWNTMKAFLKSCDKLTAEEKKKL
jgi:hypothetical protein